MGECISDIKNWESLMLSNKAANSLVRYMEFSIDDEFKDHHH